MVTFLIAAALAVLFGLAIRHLIKHGTCDCSSKGGCNGGCAGCPHCCHGAEQSQKHKAS
ncbi:MAG TPA: FeoB-associated Cys-rich membrane protein [Candidatus Anaeromassilibacillus stercoravium]|nr:FeoB-associated Cys-rich membrane protein [Candidatus Anaeromassilibacillus stercoravium]